MIPLPNTVPLKLVAALVAGLMLALLVQDRNRWKSKAQDYVQLLSAERAAHAATVANYRAAAERARREDAENLARVKASQAAINERTANDYESRIAAARAAASRLRSDAGAGADPSSGGGAAMSGIPASAERADEAAGKNRLPDADRLIATEQAIQLDELIRWVRAQSQIDRSD